MTRTRIILAVLVLVFAACPSFSAEPKTKGYSFLLPPEKAIGAVAKLEKVSGQKVVLTDDERRLFSDARDGKLDTMSFGESCLIASGMTDAVKRKVYVAKLDAIEADARKAIEGAKSAAEKAERLLKFLHDGPMKGGYESKQTDLPVVLDTGKFNCVSSAVLFNVIGRRLELDLVAVEVPGHVLALLRDGDKKIDVETTSPLGVDPKDLKTPKGKAPADRYAGKRREVGELGLASVIAYNHGVAMLEAKKFHEAVLSNFRALSLDPTNPGAAHNAMAGFTKWGLDLDHAGKFEEALAVVATGLEVSPQYSALLNNHKVLWHHYAEACMKAGKADEAIAILRRAAKVVDGEDFETQQAFLFIEPGQKLVEAGKYKEALALYTAGIAKVDKKAAVMLKESRVGLFLRRAEKAMDKGEFEEAVKILTEGAKLEPKDGHIQNNTKALYDSWADSFMKKGDWAGAIGVYEKGLATMPGDSHMKNNLAYCKQEQAKK